METRELEVEVPPRPRREEFGQGAYAQERYDLHCRRWRAEVNQLLAVQMPVGFGLFKWRVEERPGGRWVAVAEIVGAAPNGD
jgi:hypothetical protein